MSQADRSADKLESLSSKSYILSIASHQLGCQPTGDRQARTSNLQNKN